MKKSKRAIPVEVMPVAALQRRPYAGKWADVIQAVSDLPAGQAAVCRPGGSLDRAAHGLRDILWRLGYRGELSIRRHSGGRLVVERRK